MSTTGYQVEFELEAAIELFQAELDNVRRHARVL